MTDQATRVVPAGWYQDPAIGEQVRWWNGLAWTEHVREKPTVVAAPAEITMAATTGVAETSAERVAAGRELERQFGIGTSENEIITGATALGFGSAVHAAESSGASTEVARRTVSHSATGGGLNPANPAVQRAAASSRGGMRSARSATGPAWLIALTPALTLATGAVAAYLYFYVASTPLVFVIAFLLPYLLGVLWAIGDSRALRSRGFRPPSPAWSLLGGLVYLIARRIRIAGSGPLVMFLVVGVALAVVVPGAVYGSGELRPLSYALHIQDAINRDYTHTGRAVSVSCPPFVDAATPGTLYSCSATLASGATAPVWVSIDGPDGQFSYAMSL